MVEAKSHGGTGEGVDPRVLRTRDDVLAAAIDVLVNQGWDLVTQANVARVAGYSKATVYTHWPDRIELIRDAFARFGQMPHHVPTGDLRSDLIAELTSFRRAMVDHRLDRALTVLADRSASVPQLRQVRTQFVEDGERTVRLLLAPVTEGATLESATLMLCGSVMHSVLMHGMPPTDEVIESAVDVTLRGLS